MKRVLMTEFSPVEYFYRQTRFWWFLVVTGLVGGAIGLLKYQSQPRLYEAKASFFISIDVTLMQSLGLPGYQYQYNEDLALNGTQAILTSTELLSAVADECSRQNISVSQETLLQNSTIERKHAIWELRFRDRDPQVAKIATNLWAEKAYEAMLIWLREGKIANYVMFAPPTLAILPQEPIGYGRNRLMLAGSLIGLCAGIMMIEMSSRFIP